MQQTASAYSFSSQPKAVGATRKKYREPGEEFDPGVYRDLKETCITWDKRVHRGNTYSLYTQNAIRDAIQEVVSGTSTGVRNKRKPVEKSIFDMPLPEKEKVPIDLSKYLVADEGPPVETQHIEAQTDEFLPEPPPDHYRPQKTGIDVSTQVENGELYDFDYEAEPILDVLVNKTLEQAIMETEEEDELQRMQEFKTEWHKRQVANMKDWAAQVAEEQVRWVEKEKVAAERRETRRREARVLLKLQAMAAAKLHLGALAQNAIDDLGPVALPDSTGMTVTREFVPLLVDKVHAEVEAAQEAAVVAAAVAAERVRAQVQRQQEGFAAHKRRSMDAKRRRFEEMQIRHGRIRIAMDDGAGGERMVGPIQISTQDTVEGVQERVHAWLRQHEAALAEAWPRGVLLAVDGKPIQATAEVFAANLGAISIQQPPEAPPAEADGEGANGEGDDENAEGDDS